MYVVCALVCCVRTCVCACICVECVYMNVCVHLCMCCHSFLPLTWVSLAELEGNGLSREMTGDSRSSSDEANVMTSSHCTAR